MKGFAANAIFCDDIRREIDDRFTIVGTLTDNLQVGGTPTLLPKLGIFGRINLPLDQRFGPFEFVLVQTDGKEHQIGHFTEEAIRDEQDKARTNGNDLVGFIATAVSAPFHISQPGTMKVELRYEDEVLLLTSVLVIASE